MPGSNRRFTLAATALPLLFLAMPGLSRAATITVNTLADTSMSGQCSLRDAITAANSQAAVNGCIAGSLNNDTIIFAGGQTGTITLGSTLPQITDANLAIVGPASSPGITISGGGSVPLMLVNFEATLNLQLLTLTNGSENPTEPFGAGGGAISNAGKLIVTNCTFSNNVAGGDGGGAIESSDGSLTVTDSTFLHNQVTSQVSGGGAILNDGDSVLTVTNSTFWHNTASTGAALSNDSPALSNAGASMTVTDCTFVDNQAPAVNAFSGAVCNLNGNASMEESILAGNTGTNCQCYGVGLTNEGYNISDDDTCHFGTSTGASGQTLGDDVFPLLASSPANNGGPTETIALLPPYLAPNPAIAAVPLAQCSVRTDQRGYGRPAPGYTACSVGAYEFEAVSPVIIRGVVHGGLLITSGQVYNIEGGTVTGDVLQLGGSLVVTDSSTIKGSVLTAGPSTFSFDDSAIGGDLLVLGLPVGSPPDQICGTTVNGDVLVLGDKTDVTIGDPTMACPGNTIGRNLQVLDNETVQIFDDMVGGNLQCQDNTTIAGSGDTAKSLRGQCAGFAGLPP